MEKEDIEFMGVATIYHACAESAVDNFVRDVMTTKIPTGSTLGNDFYSKRVVEIWDENKKLRTAVFGMLSKFRNSFAKGISAMETIQSVPVAGYYNDADGKYNTAKFYIKMKKIEEGSPYNYPALVFEYDEVKIRDGKPVKQYISRIECIVEDYEQADDLYGAFEVA